MTRVYLKVIFKFGQLGHTVYPPVKLVFTGFIVRGKHRPVESGQPRVVIVDELSVEESSRVSPTYLGARAEKSGVSSQGRFAARAESAKVRYRASQTSEIAIPTLLRRIEKWRTHPPIAKYPRGNQEDASL